MCALCIWGCKKYVSEVIMSLETQHLKILRNDLCLYCRDSPDLVPVLSHKQITVLASGHSTAPRHHHIM